MSISCSAPKIQEGSAVFRACYRSVIGVDVHSNLMVAQYQRCDFGSAHVETEDYKCGATRSELHGLARWCRERNPELIIMESTGIYWLTPYEILEDHGFAPSQIAVCNARDVKNRRGRKTDRSDAVHLAEIGRQGSFRSSFVPSKFFRQMRMLWRSAEQARGERQRKLNVLHKQLTAVGCRFSSVFSDIRGKTATRVLELLVSGARGEEFREGIKAIKAGTRGRLKHTADEIWEALQADMESPVWFAIRKTLEDIGSANASYNGQLGNIKQLLEPYRNLIDRLMTVPGIKETAAIGIVCELGNDLGSFASVRKFCAWVGLASGNNESAGKRYSGHTTKGNKYLRRLLVECAGGIGLMKKGFLSELFQKFKERKGRNRAAVAIAHKLCRIIFAMIRDGSEYQENSKPVLKPFELGKFKTAAKNLKDQGFRFNDVHVDDPETGEKITVKGSRSREQRSQSSELI